MAHNFTTIPFQLLAYDAVESSGQFELNLNTSAPRSHPSLCMSYIHKAPGIRKTLIWTALYDYALQVASSDPQGLERRLSSIERSLTAYQESGTEIEISTGQFCIDIRTLKKVAKLDSLSIANIHKLGKDLQNTNVELNVFSDAQIAGFRIEKTYQAPLILHYTPQANGLGVEYIFDPKLYFFLFHPKFKKEFLNHRTYLDFSRTMSPQLYALCTRAYSDSSLGWIHLPTALGILQGAESYPSMRIDTPMRTELRNFTEALDQALAELNGLESLPFKVTYKLVHASKYGVFEQYVPADKLKECGWFLAFDVQAKTAPSVQEQLETETKQYAQWKSESIRTCYSRALAVYGYSDNRGVLRSWLDAHGENYWLGLELAILEGINNSSLNQGHKNLHPELWKARQGEIKALAGRIMGSLLKNPEMLAEKINAQTEGLIASEPTRATEMLQRQLNQVCSGSYLLPWNNLFPLSEQPRAFKDNTKAAPDAERLFAEKIQTDKILEYTSKIQSLLVELSQAPHLYDNAVAKILKLTQFSFAGYPTMQAEWKTENRFTSAKVQQFIARNIAIKPQAEEAIELLTEYREQIE